MKIGIVVVYMLKTGNQKLLELHLRQIRAMTNVPYKIYAGINQGVQPSFLKLLKHEPHMKLISLPETGMKGGEQHAFYLEHLLKVAVLDDITHIVIMHVDSFPVRSDWVEIIAGKLVGNCVLSTISHNHYLALYTACLCFRKDFYLKYNPCFFLSENELFSDDYRHFSRQHAHYTVDSGVGFVFNAYCLGLSWVALERSNMGEDHGWHGSIYEDSIFHLVGAYRHRRSSKLDRVLKLNAVYLPLFTVANGLRVALKGRIPNAIWHCLRCLSFSFFLSQPSHSYDTVIDNLLNDPKSYINYLRYGDNIK